MDFEEILENPAFYILSAVGVFAFILMLVVLKTMGQKEIMPWWVKIITILAIPVAAAAFSGWAAGD